MPSGRRVMLGDVIGVKTRAIVGFGDLEAVLVKIRQRRAGAIEVIENAEFHACSLVTPCASV
jgi:hypothetical protein